MKYNAFISYSHSQDAVLAPSLEESLEKFAKPIFKRRALNIFRDSNDLSVSPNLWSKIEEGLAQSEYFIFFASAASSKSHYCKEEVKYWLSHKNVDHMLIALTDGDLIWDHEKSDFDWSKTTAVPTLLSGVFENEPLYVDFREQIPQSELNLDNPDFKKKTVLLAATLHKKAVGDMVGEGVRQYKRTKHIKNGALIVLFSLMTIVLLLAMITIQRNNASILHFQAKAMESVDPTVALRLEVKALGVYDNPDFKKSAFSIINTHSFYKTLAIKDTSPFRHLDVSPVDKIFVVARDNGVVGLYDLAGKLVHQITEHKAGVNAVAFSPDGKTILTGSDDKTARLISLQGAVITEFNGHQDGVNSVAFSPDGKTVLTASSDGTVRLSDLKNNLIKEFNLNELISSAAFAPNGNSVLVGFNGSSVAARLLDLDGKKIQDFGEGDRVNSVAFSPDGEKILTGSWDNSARLWSLDGRVTKEFKSNSVVMLPGEISPLTAVFSPDGNTILTGSWENTARLWDLKGNLIKEFKGHERGVSFVAFASEGQSVLTGSYDNTVRIWNLNGMQGIKVGEFKAHSKRITSIALAPDGQSILTGSDDKTAHLWDLDGNLKEKFTADHPFGVISVAFSSDGQTIFTGSRDAIARSWSLEGSLKEEINMRQMIVKFMAFSPDSKYIVTNQSLRNRIDSTNTALKLEGAATFSLEGTTILAGAQNHSAQLLNVDGTVVTEFKGHQEGVISVAFSPDGKTVLTGASDHTARLWKLDGTLITEYRSEEISVSLVAFAPDGKTILTGSVDSWFTYKGTDTGIAQLWNLEGTKLMTLNRENMEITAATFFPDGNLIITGYSDGTAVLFRKIQIHEFLERYVEPLSDNQKKKFGIN